MTQENLQDALGYLDDDMIATVDELRHQRDLKSDIASLSHRSSADNALSATDTFFSSFRKRIVRREMIKWGSLAASICLLIGVTWIWSRVGSSTDTAGTEKTPNYSYQENMEAVLDQKLEDSMVIQTFPAAETIQQEAAGEETPETSPETSPALTTQTPPKLTVLCGDTSITATSGNYEWSQDNGDGITNFVIACGMHPLDCEDSLARIHTTQSMAELQFVSAPSAPYEISVQSWSEAHWGDMLAKSEIIPVTDGQILLKPGGYIYEITAKWARGTVQYAFYAYYEGGTVESFTGIVIYCSAVAQDPGNYVLKLDTDNQSITFTIVESTQLIGIERTDQLQRGDSVSLTCIRESEDVNSYRCVTVLEVIP